ncbi:MAG: glycosyltransferase family 4 protein [Tildeniella torsiva UHER 1998/13D]|jgi:glycosyltransferase involved in cell wall biosynthesis|nr:glycosyltransferase family 4 protein [Tildeniella torsiva UHER 1998/13D]
MTYHGNMDASSGASGSMIRIGSELQKRGINVEYFTYDDLPKFRSKRTYHFLFPYFLYRYVKDRSFDIVDACTGDTWLLGLLRNRKNLKIVIRSSGLEHMEFDSRLRYRDSIPLKTRIVWGHINLSLVALSLRTADHIVALTNKEKEYIRNKFKFPESKISIFHHVLPQYFSHLPKPSCLNTLKILYVGVWNERKGIHYLIDALEKLVETNCSFSVTFVGIRIEEEAVCKYFSDSLSKFVKIISSIDHENLPQIYLDHNVFVFPSRYEGFGKVVTEAMASGIPIITTSVGIADEFIEHHVDGIKIPCCNSEAIYNALVWVLKHPQEAKIYGQRGREKLKKTDYTLCYQQRIDMYNKLL